MALSYIKDRLFLYLALVIFIIVKVPHLHYAFYWDESYVYAPAIFEMQVHGPSLLPDAIPVKYSTGHPLLFYAACAAWMNVFGSSHFSMHCFALVIVLILAIVLFEVLLRLFNKKIAFTAIALLLLNMHFYIYSSLVLSDITIGLLAFLVLYFYIKEKHFLTAVFLTLLFFTKESGIVAGLLIIMDIFILLITKKKPWKNILMRCATVAIPLSLLLLFFVQQKKIRGWYLYPLHTSALDLTAGHIFANLQSTLMLFFYSDRAYFFPLVFVLLVAFVAFRLKNAKYIWLLLPALVIYLSLFTFSYKDVIFYPLAAFILIALAAFYLKPLRLYNNVQERFIKIVLSFCLLYTLFCCINFYEERYLFPALLMAIVLLSVLLDSLVARLNASAFPFVLGSIISFGIFNWAISNSHIELYDRLDVQQHVVDFFEKNNFYKKNIASTAFLEREHLKDPKTGFLRYGKTFGNVNDQIDQHTELAIFDNIEYDENYEQIKRDSNFSLLYHYQKGNEWAAVYQHR